MNKDMDMGMGMDMDMDWEGIQMDEGNGGEKGVGVQGEEQGNTGLVELP